MTRDDTADDTGDPESGANDEADHGMGETDERTLGVEFGDLEDDLKDAEYPLSREELLDRYGDREIQLADTTERLRDVLEAVGEQSYESAEDVTQTVVGMVGDEAVGRKAYTDRSTSPDEEDHDVESL